MVSAPRSRSTLVLFAFLTAVTVLAPHYAAALPPGIYSLGGEYDARRPGVRRDRIRSLANDGEWVSLGVFREPLELLYTDGRRELAGTGGFDTGQPPEFDLTMDVFGIADEGTTRVGTQRWIDPDGGGRGHVDVIQPAVGPAVVIDQTVSERDQVSSNGDFVLGQRLSLTPPGTPFFALPTNPTVWNRHSGWVDYDTPSGRSWVDPMFIADDGTVVGTTVTLNAPPFEPVVLEGVVVWSPDGSARELGPLTLDDGSSWTPNAPRAISRDGRHIVAGYEVGGMGVIGPDDSVWRLNLGGTTDPAGEVIFEANAISGDGSIVVGRSGSTAGCSFGPVVVCRASVWTRNEGRFDFETYLRLAGLDPTGWDFDSVADVSHDGRIFVGYGQYEDGEDYLFYAVIPEPSTALLLGLGLAALPSSRRRSA